MKKTILIIISLSVVRTAVGSERLVPSQYPTIQDAINAAENGDTVIVEANTYRENIDYIGKAITVRSSNPNDFESVRNTIIDGVQRDCCVVFRTGESSNSVLEGFTLTNGAGSNVDYSSDNGHIKGEAGGGILCLNSSPTIKYCNITGNEVRSKTMSRMGRGTTTILYGGGIALIGNCQATIDNCFITNNHADYGPGIIIRGLNPEQATSTIMNCTVANNNSNLEASVYEIDCWDTKPVIYNTIIWNRDYPSLLIADPSLVTYCCVRDAYIFEGDYDEFAEPFDLTGIAGNINQNPLFVLPAAGLEIGDYHLLPDSPCVNVGDPDFVDSDKLDLDGQSRLLGGRIDIGADEVLSQIYVNTPTGGEVWASGSTHEIKWISSAVSTVDVVDILMSTNGGTDWQTIETGIPNTGSKIWTLPEAVDSNNCLVSVVPSIPDSNIICTESKAFRIRPYSPGIAIESKWKSLGGNFTRTGLSDGNGPEFGCIKWQFETTKAVSASVTVGADNRVYIPCEDGKLYALDPNGSLIWSYDANSPLISSPTIGLDGTVYVGGMNGKLYAVDINGNLLWTHSTEGFIYSSPAVSAEGKIYVGSQDGVLYALDRDGSELWNFETKGLGEVTRGSIFASPAIGADETVYISGLYDPNLYALDPIDGSIKWACNFESQGWPFTSPVIADDGIIYQTLVYDSNLYAVDPQDGSIIWSTDLRIRCDFVDQYFATHNMLPPLDQIRENCEYWIQYPTEIDSFVMIDTYAAYILYSNSDCWSEPTLGPDGKIYVSFDDPYLRAIDPNGSIKWVTDLGYVGGFTLTVGNNGNIYAACDDGNLYVVNPDSEEIARFQSEAWLNFPVIADNLLIVADSKDNSMLVTYENNKVYAILPECSEDQIPDLYWPADLNLDGTININDMTILASYWLRNE